MPRVKVEREVSNDGVWKRMEIEAAAGGEDKDRRVTTQYTVPATPAAFAAMIAGLSDKPDSGAFVQHLLGPDKKDQNESPLAWAHRLFNAAIDRAARLDVYESIAAESTIITVSGEKVDIMTFTPKNLVRGINRYRDDRRMKLEIAFGVKPGQELDDEVVNAPENAAKVADVEKAVRFGPWRTAAIKLIEAGTARENPASGMLELVG